ncbi:unnamed protein product [Somion occarium]|uniref:Arrestin-like N-terminal domain-containing protein n=1 Tax=Somion occarium TaxID=3059160 RepID=A0ABP1DB42_9APHY
MVQLILAPLRGNAGGRYFPYQGYLGLTPVRVEGGVYFNSPPSPSHSRLSPVVCTRLEDDGKPILAKSLAVAVRCYESRQGKTGVIHSRLLVDYACVVWRKPDDRDYADLGHFDGSFKITLPKRVAGFSTAHYQEYRTFWRVEAILDHVPISGVGSRLLRYFDLPLVRYDVPPPLPPLSPGSPSPMSHCSTPHILCLPNAKSPTPVLHYNLSTPELPIGPADLVFTSLYLRPLESSLTIRSASVFIERRIDLHSVHSNPNASTSSYAITPDATDDSGSGHSPKDGYFHSAMGSSSNSPAITLSSSVPESSSSSSRRPRTPYLSPPAQRTFTLEVPSTASPSSSSYTVSSITPLIPSSPSPSTPSTQSFSCPPPPTPTTDAPSKTLTTTITYADSGVGGFAYDASTGIWSKSVSMQWPKSKSRHVWAMGESVKSELAEVSFWVKVKVIVTSPNFGTTTLDLEPREITVVSTNDSDRRLALAKFAEQKETVLAMREKSRDRERENNSKTPSTVSTGEKRSQESYVLVEDNTNSSSTESQPGKSPRKSHHDRPRLDAHSTPNPTSSSSASSPSSRKSTRRPHTSAGPRDKSNLPYTSPPDSATSHSHRSGGQTRSGGGGRPGTGISVNEVQVPRSSVSSNRGVGGGGVVDVNGGGAVGVGVGGNKEDAIKAWEEELARIENASRRSTADMLAFFGMGKRRRKEKEKVKEREKVPRGIFAGV